MMRPNTNHARKATFTPDSLGFAKPDFGFNDSLNFYGEDQPGWQNFVNCVAPTPRFERVRNYIEFSTEQQQVRDNLKKQTFDASAVSKLFTKVELHT